MAKISNDTISGIKDSDELIGFIALYRYEPENSDLLEKENFGSLPELVRHIILILDFETEYEMQGLFTLLDNTTGSFLPLIAESFEKTDNKEIAENIKAILSILSDSSSDSKSMEDRLMPIDKKLSELINDKGYWTNIIKAMDKHLMS